MTAGAAGGLEGVSVGRAAAYVATAALLLGVAPGFVSVARLLLLDGLLVLCVTASVMCGFEAVRTGRLKHGWWVAAALASGFGFLTKGPISEVLLFVPLWAFGFLSRNLTPNPLPCEGRGLSPSPLRGGVGEGFRLVRWFHYALFFGIVIAVNVPWYVAMYFREPAFLKHFFWEHNVLRFLQPFDHLQPVWYYAPLLLAGLLPGTILFVAYFRNLLSHADESRPSLAGGFWLLAGGWCVFFFSCSGSKLPTYILPAYPFLCLALGEFIARTKWNRALSTRVMVAAMAGVLLFVHHVGLPWYARERSPFGRPELVVRFVEDRETVVVTYPRNCDSVAFYSGRSDFDQVRTRETNQLMVDCHHRPRTVILFTHKDSLAGFRNTLPPSLEIVETTSLKRTFDSSALNKVFGSTPWGLCDVAVVVPRMQ